MGTKSRATRAHQKGMRNEARTLKILKDAQAITPWLINVRTATPEEDARGIDIVCTTTDEENLYVQVKSSKTGAEKFMDGYMLGMRGPVPIVVIITNRRKSDETLQTELLDKLETLRQRIKKFGSERWKQWQADMIVVQQALHRHRHHASPRHAHELTSRVTGMKETLPWIQIVSIMNVQPGMQTRNFVRLQAQETSLIFICLNDEKAARKLEKTISGTSFACMLHVYTGNPIKENKFRRFLDRLNDSSKRWLIRLRAQLESN